MARFQVNLWYGEGLFPRDKSAFIVDARDKESLKAHLEQYRGDTAAFMPSHLQDDNIPADLKLRIIEVNPEFLPAVKFCLESVELSAMQGKRYYED